MTAAVIANTWVVSDLRLKAFAIAIGTVLAALILLSWLAKNRSATARPSLFGQLVCGFDGRASTSKFQAVLWTMIAVFGFVEVFVERLLLGTTAGDSTIPTNMLIAMGFSVTTMATAKGITVSYAARSLVDKSGDKQGRKLGGLVTDDDDVPDLSKIQMLAFTAIAALVYLIRMVCPDHWTPELVDIEPALMVLMGLSQGAYIGKKLTTTETPRVVGVSPAIGNSTTKVTLTGAAFGDQQDGGVVLFGETPANVSTWGNSKIELTPPGERTPGTPWANGDRVPITVISNGRDALALTQFVYRA